MKITKDKALELFSNYPQAVASIHSLSGNIVCIEIMDEKKYKTNKQNALFHSLLSCFWASGCSSFDTYDELRLYYKRVVGLVVPGARILKEMSWSEATKEQAKQAIDLIIRDMDFAQVSGSVQGYKYQEILKGLGEIC